MVNPNHDSTGQFAPYSIPKTAELKSAFLSRYAQMGTILHACDGVVAYKTVELWRKNDPEFEAAFAVAARQYVQKLEQEADRRAVEGVDTGVYYRGNRVASEKQFSDTLLIFRLKRLDPQYRDRHEITGADGGPVTIRVVEDG